MKETGIIMTDKHPYLILDGIKTQTRRVVSSGTSIVGEGRVDWSNFDWEQKTEYDFGDSRYSTESEFVPDELKGQLMGVQRAPAVFVDDSFGIHYLHVPYRWSENATVYRIYPRYEVGDLLWVRETWYPAFKRTEENNGIIYYADGSDFNSLATRKHGWGKSDCKWEPSIFMPRWASRITLEITEVRVERVQEISWRDCKREGVETEKASFSPFMEPWRDAFERLWDSLNAKRGYGWEVNPWCWVISFKAVK